MHCECERAKICVYGPHKGHNLEDPSKVLHLRVKDCCMDDLFDVGYARHVAKLSIRKETMHKSKAPPD